MTEETTIRPTEPKHSSDGVSELTIQIHQRIRLVLRYTSIYASYEADEDVH